MVSPTLDRIERLTDTLSASARQQPEVAKALEEIARDSASRDRYLAFAREELNRGPGSPRELREFRRALALYVRAIKAELALLRAVADTAM